MAILEIKNLTKIYLQAKKEVVALSDITLRIENGEFITIVGPSGSGKTTLIRCIAGLETITKGKISLDGLSKYSSSKENRYRTEWLPQKISSTFFDDYNVLFNLNVILKLINNAKLNSRLLEVASLLKIEKLLDRFPRELSGGELQRVAIARALLNNSEIFLFDEPLTSIDELTKKDLRKLFYTHFRKIGVTVLYITHSKSEALSLGQKCLFLNNGKVEQFDTPQNVFNKPETPFVAEFFSDEWNQYYSYLSKSEMDKIINSTFIDFSAFTINPKGAISTIGFRGEDIKVKISSKSQYISLGLWNVRNSYYLGNKVFADCTLVKKETVTASVFIDQHISEESIELFINKENIFGYQVDQEK